MDTVEATAAPALPMGSPENVWVTVAQGFVGVAEALERLNLGLNEHAGHIEIWKETFYQV